MASRSAANIDSAQEVVNILNIRASPRKRKSDVPGQGDLPLKKRLVGGDEQDARYGAKFMGLRPVGKPCLIPKDTSELRRSERRMKALPLKNANTLLPLSPAARGDNDMSGLDGDTGPLGTAIMERAARQEAIRKKKNRLRSTTNTAFDASSKVLNFPRRPPGRPRKRTRPSTFTVAESGVAVTRESQDQILAQPSGARAAADSGRQVTMVPDMEKKDGGDDDEYVDKDHPDAEDEHEADHQQHEAPAAPEDGGTKGDEQSLQKRRSRAYELPEEISMLFRCQAAWDILLKAVEDLDCQEVGIETSRMGEVATLIKKIRIAYRSIRDAADPENPQSSHLEADIKRNVEDLKQALGQMEPTGKHEDRILIKEIYLHAIPKLVLLLKGLIRARYRDGNLDLTALEELVDLIKFTRKVCAKALEWQPRPTGLERGSKKLVRETIPRELGYLLKAYKAALRQAKQAEVAAREDLDWIEVENGKMQKRRQLAEWLEAKQACERERLQRHARAHRTGTPEKESLAEVVDIDGLNLNFEREHDLGHCAASTSPPRNGTGVYASQFNSQLGQPSHKQIPTMPRMSRERTEDIPPNPIDREWEEYEDAALLAGLESHSGPNRYLNIANEYGSRSGPLSRRDLDELMHRASFYKESMKTEIEEEIKAKGDGRRWEFLTSVKDQFQANSYSSRDIGSAV